MIKVVAPDWGPEGQEPESWVDRALAIVPETYNGIATSPFVDWVIEGLEHRFADLRDCGRVSIGAGLGVSVEARAGDFSTVALGSQALTLRFGTENRTLYGVWQSLEQPFPWAYLDPPEGVAGVLARSSVSYKRKEVQSKQITKNIISTYRCEPVGHWHPFYIRTDEEKDAFFNRALDVEASVVAGAVSARAGINVLEILDFALGFLTIDIARDDD